MSHKQLKLDPETILHFELKELEINQDDDDGYTNVIYISKDDAPKVISALQEWVNSEGGSGEIDDRRRYEQDENNKTQTESKDKD